MKDKDKIDLILRAHESGKVDLDYATNFILRVYGSSKRFNYHSFWIGMFVGTALMYVLAKHIL